MQALQEKFTIKRHWKVCKYKTDDDYLQGRKPFEVVDINGNLFLNEGIQEMLDLMIAAGGTTAYNNASARLGVGNEALTVITGTSIQMTNGSAAVVGVGTSFTTQLAVGDLVALDADDVLATVQSITDDLNLVLTANYSGAGGTGTGKFAGIVIATETALKGASSLYKAMEATYPSRAAQTLTFRSAFTSTEANFAWREASLDNGNTANKNLNRKISSLGTKTTGTWTLELTLTIQ